METIAGTPFAKVWVLLASRRQETAFRERLLSADDDRHVYFNTAFFDFYDLYHHLLDEAGSPQHRMSDTVRFRILRLILRQLDDANRLGDYSAIARKPGFVRVVADFIYELKQNHVYPDAFQRASSTTKDHVLADIYTHYQAALQDFNLVDREGEGWLALVEVDRRPNIARDVDLLLIDGFDQFTPVQSELIKLLSSRVGEAFITLTRMPGRDVALGRRFERTLERLNKIDNLEHLELAVPSQRPATLQHVVDSLFLSSQQIAPIAADAHIQFIETPDVAQEVHAILRRIKRLLVTGSCQPDDVVIVLRDWGRYQPHFTTHGQTSGIPMALHLGEPLAENPAVIALLTLLTLHESTGHVLAFGWRDLLDVLRSPYFDVPDIGAEQADLLERISRELLVRGGQAAWLNAIKAAQHPRWDEDDEEHEAILNQEDAGDLHDAIQQFFSHVTPPAQSTVAGYVQWLEDLIGHDPALEYDEELTRTDYTLAMFQCVRDGSDAMTARDLAAMQGLKRLLHGLVASQGLLEQLEGNQAVVWDEFYGDLLAAIHSDVVDRRPYRDGLVLVTTATDARGLPHRHVFIPGLAEGIFPAQLPEDPLYLDSERQQLAKSGVELETQAARSADDSLFYELVGLARESLTLSRPTLQEGVPWVESHLWRAAQSVFTDADSVTTSTRIGQVADVDDVAGVDEAALVVAQRLTTGTFDEDVAGLYNWLVTEHGDYWQHIRTARQVEHHRAMRHIPHNHYSGRLHDAHVVDEVRSRLGESRIWSASQFNEYGSCGFRFFARRLLKLEELEEIEDGIDARQLGLLNHAILEHTYLRLREKGGAIAPANIDEAISILQDVAHAQFVDAPQRIGFQSTLWEQEKIIVLRQLENMVRLDFSEKSPVTRHFGSGPRYPYHLEARFGVGSDNGFTLNLDGETIRIIGFIDRIDRVGDELVVIDYKSGRSKIPVSEMEIGHNFQMMLYLLAAQHMIDNDDSPDAPTHIAGGLFWLLSSNEATGVFKFGKNDAALEAAREHVKDYIHRARAGDFAVSPPKLEYGKCTRYCEFYRLCRIGVTNHYKSSSASP